MDYTLSVDEYYIGSTTRGWNDTTWGFVFDTTTLALPIAQNFCAFSLPYDLVTGNTLTLCGSSYTETNNSGLYWFLAKYSCGDGLTSGEVAVEIIDTGSASYTYDEDTGAYYMCFSDTMTMGKAYASCDDKLILGFRVAGFNVNTNVRVSWMLKKNV